MKKKILKRLYYWFILICVLLIWFILLNDSPIINQLTKNNWNNSIDYRVSLVIYAESWTTEEDILNSIKPLSLDVGKINITTGYKIEEYNIPDDAIWYEIKLENYVVPYTFHNKDKEQLEENKAFYYVGFWEIVPWCS